MLLGPYSIGEVLLFLIFNIWIGAMIWHFSGKEGRPRQGMQLIAAWALLVLGVLSHPSIQYQLAQSRLPAADAFEFEEGGGRANCWRLINSYSSSPVANNCAVAIYSDSIKKVWFGDTDGGRRWFTPRPWTWLLLIASVGLFASAWKERE